MTIVEVSYRPEHNTKEQKMSTFELPTNKKSYVIGGKSFNNPREAFEYSMEKILRRNLSGSFSTGQIADVINFMFTNSDEITDFFNNYNTVVAEFVEDAKQ